MCACVFSYVCSHVCVCSHTYVLVCVWYGGMCFLLYVCVLSGVRSHMCVLMCELSYVCSQVCALMWLLTHVRLRVCVCKCKLLFVCSRVCFLSVCVLMHMLSEWCALAACGSLLIHHCNVVWCVFLVGRSGWCVGIRTRRLWGSTWGVSFSHPVLHLFSLRKMMSLWQLQLQHGEQKSRVAGPAKTKSPKIRNQTCDNRSRSTTLEHVNHVFDLIIIVYFFE